MRVEPFIFDEFLEQVVIDRLRLNVPLVLLDDLRFASIFRVQAFDHKFVALVSGQVV